MNLVERLERVFSVRNLAEMRLKDIPQPHTMKNLSQASEILKNAITKNQKIAIIGDYDVDGIASVSIVEHFFDAIKYKNFVSKIPNRFSDGYGICEKFIDELDADIYLTLDNGIVAFDVAEYCARKDKILIISDHHKPLVENDVEILPRALVVNPHQQSCNFLQKDICGAMIAWYLCAGIKQALQDSTDISFLSPFVALAIISDVMPLRALNRVIYKLGARKMQESSIPAFIVMREKIKLNSSNIAFFVAPILNSAGRMEDAKIALDFFRARDVKTANERYCELLAINDRRKQTQQQVFEDAQKPQNIIHAKHMLVAKSNDWHEGVLGIVASKLAEKYEKSVFCLNLENGIYKGSGRAFGGINLIATLQKCQESFAVSMQDSACDDCVKDSAQDSQKDLAQQLFVKFGGHCAAVGLSLEEKNINAFVSTFDTCARIEPQDSLDVTICVRLEELSPKVLELLESFEPYGEANEEIVFRAENVLCESRRIFGKDAQYQALIFKQDKCVVEGVLFNDTRDFSGKILDIAFLLQRDSYTNSPRLIVREIKIA